MAARKKRKEGARAIDAERRAMRDMDYQPLPLNNFDDPAVPETSRGKVPPAGWRTLQGVPPYNPEWQNTGARTGDGGFYPLDADVDDADAAAVNKAVAFRILGPTCAVRSRSNSPRVLLGYRTAKPMKKRVIKLSVGKNEFLGEGQQVHAYGRHYSGVELVWNNGGLTGTPLSALPLITEEQIEAFAREMTRIYPPVKKTKAKPNGSGYARQNGSPSTAELIDAIRAGEALHDSNVMLAARMIGGGQNSGFVVNFIRELMEETPEAERDGRWHERYDDVPRAVRTAEAKWGGANPENDDDEFGGGAGKTESDDPFAGTEALPLCPEPRLLEPFPLMALGPLQTATEGIAECVDCEPSLAAQSVLMVACLAVMGIADIDLPRIGITPLMLYLITVAVSGERKSSADRRALRGVKARVSQLKEEREARAVHHINAVKIHAAESKAILHDKKLDRATKQTRLDGLGPEPKPLLKAVLAAHDVTVEGVLKAWAKGELWPVQALTTSEGGMFVSGAAMSHEMRMRTVSTLCALWDCEDITKLRAGDGVMSIGTKRIAVHLMIQPNFIPELLGDAVLRSQGFLSRLLVSWPRSKIGERFGDGGSPVALAAERAFTDRIHDLLFRHLKEELEPGTLRVEGEAAGLWIAYSKEIEAAQRPGAQYAELTDVASKSAEMAGRIAGVLTLYDKPGATTVPAQTMRNAIVLARWYLNEALRIAETGVLRPEIVDAKELLEWFKANPDRRTRREVMHRGPNRLRPKHACDRALHVLADHNLIALPKRGPIVIRDDEPPGE